MPTFVKQTKSGETAFVGSQAGDTTNEAALLVLRATENNGQVNEHNKNSAEYTQPFSSKLLKKIKTITSVLFLAKELSKDEEYVE